MPWPCRVVEDFTKAENPGDMWEEPHGWYIVLPGGGIHNIHAKFSDGSGWTVTGEAPNFTVTPSIRCYDSRLADGTMYRKGWHGYLTNGVLTDDYDGRTYEE